MTYCLLLTVYCLLFTFITWHRFTLGLFFLFLLLPTYLIRFNIGPLPTTVLELMIWIILIIWLLKYNKSIPYHLSLIIKKHKTLSLASFLFLLAATISIFTSTDIRAALGEWKAFYIEPFLIFLVLVTTLKKDNNVTIQQFNNGRFKHSIEMIIFALILSGLATSTLAIYQHFTGWMVPWEFWENGNSFRVTGWYGFPNAVGLFLAPILPLAIYLSIHSYKKIKNKLPKKFTTYHISLITSILFIILSIPAIFFAKSTGALVGIAAGIGILLLFYKKTRLPVIIIGLVSFVSFVGLVNFSQNQTIHNIKNELTLQDRSGQLRINMWAETVEFLQDRPITGAGLASYKTLIYPYRIDKWVEVFHHPHNIFLTMWVNLGLLGLIGFLWILVSLITYHFFILKKKNKLPTINYFLLASLVVILTTGLVDSPYIKNDLAVLFWAIISLLVLKKRPHNISKVG